jgi:hypothetical protein
MKDVKILNLRFKNVSNEKEELLKEAVGIIKGKVAEKERLEYILRSAGVRVAFHWPREMLEFVDEVRGWVKEMGYSKDDYFTR